MSFHSFDYILFLPLVVAGYFTTPLRWRWLLLLAASNIFYASWRAEFLALLWFTTLADYAIALVMPRTEGWRRKALMIASLIANLGMLLVFKYFELLANTVLGVLRGDPGIDTIDIILPLGISFYTFQTLGYTIDVYRSRRQPETHLGYFAVFVMYFPQLLAGPIERPGALLPQLREPKDFELRRAALGGALILVGYFKKLVIADRLAEIVPMVMNEPAAYSPLTVTAMSFASIYRYYADLSGYVDIAIGSSLIIGIRLHRNFNRPFTAVSIAEFWQRWHITVTTWFRDYVYIPIARRARGPWQRPVATILTLTIIAFWHGAQWTWLSAGILAGTIMVLEGWARRNRLAIRASGALGLSERASRRVGDWSNRAVLWGFLIFLGALVNSGSWGGAMKTWERIGSLPAALVGRNPQFGDLAVFPLTVVLAIVALEIYEWLNARRPVFERLEARGRVVSWGFYYALAALIMMFGSFDRSDFIYFNF